MWKFDLMVKGPEAPAHLTEDIQWTSQRSSCQEKSLAESAPSFYFEGLVFIESFTDWSWGSDRESHTDTHYTHNTAL